MSTLNQYLLLSLFVPCIWTKTYFMEDRCGKTISIDAYNQHFGRIKQTQLKKYKPNIRCEVKVTTNQGYRFAVIIQDLDIEYEPNCDDDYLRIIDGNTTTAPALRGLRKRLCGLQKPPGSYVSSSNVITFLFKSDVWSNEDGFDVLLTTFHEAPCDESKEFKCTNGRCIASLLTCDGFNNCGDLSDECNLSPSVILAIVFSVILVTALGMGVILYIKRYKKTKSSATQKKKIEDFIIYMQTSGPSSPRPSFNTSHPHFYPEDIVNQHHPHTPADIQGQGHSIKLGLTSTQFMKEGNYTPCEVSSKNAEPT